VVLTERDCKNKTNQLNFSKTNYSLIRENLNEMDRDLTDSSPQNYISTKVLIETNRYPNSPRTLSPTDIQRLSLQLSRICCRLTTCWHYRTRICRSREAIVWHYWTTPSPSRHRQQWYHARPYSNSMLSFETSPDRPYPKSKQQ